jgi:glycosyltransferase involved in cell wall biosynthesis
MNGSARQNRILILVENEGVPADRRVWDECRALVSVGYGVSVICPARPGEPAFSELAGVRIHRYATPPEGGTKLDYVREYAYSWIRTAGLMAKIFAREVFSAIQACNPPDTYFLAAAPFKLLGRRFVFDQHDLSPELYTGRFGRSGGPVYTALLVLERGTYLLADHVISTNQWYREVALSRGRKSPDSVTIVRNGPDLERMRRRPPRPELKEGKPLLCCFLGVMEPHDGVDLALRAAHHIINDRGRRDCHFAFLGDGESLPGLRRLATELGIDDWVTFTGWARDEMISDYLSTADLGLQPDPKDPRTDISTATKTMEYMAFGVPVVAFDLKETRTTAGEAGVYAEPNDYIAYARLVDTLLRDPSRRAGMGAEGRRRVEQSLSWGHQRIAYVRVYDELLRRPRSRRKVARALRGSRS